VAAECRRDVPGNHRSDGRVTNVRVSAGEWNVVVPAVAVGAAMLSCGAGAGCGSSELQPGVVLCAAIGSTTCTRRAVSRAMLHRARIRHQRRTRTDPSYRCSTESQPLALRYPPPFDCVLNVKSPDTVVSPCAFVDFTR